MPWDIMVKNGGFSLEVDKAGYPIPQIPSKGVPLNSDPGELVISPKTWSRATSPPMLTTSYKDKRDLDLKGCVTFERTPETAPVPYWMENLRSRLL